MQKCVVLNNLEEIIAYLEKHPDPDGFFTLPENAYSYMGISYIQQMLRIASENYPNIYSRFILSIGDSAAVFHSLIGGKIIHIKFTGSLSMYRKLENLSNRFDIKLYQS